MANTRFNIEKIREVNQFKIFSNKGKGFEPIFTAYLPAGFNINTSMDSDSAFGGIQDFLIRNLGGIMHGAKMLGFTNWTGAVDIKRYMFYKASQPITFSVNTFLVLQEDYNTDILQPLQSLMEFYLPRQQKEDANFIEDFLNEANTSFQKTLDEYGSSDKPYAKLATGVFELLQGGYAKVRKAMGPIYPIEAPPQYADGSEGQVASTIFFGKHYYFEDCFIKSVNLNFPIFLVENGRPDIVEVQISLETARVATSNMFKFDREFKFEGKDSGWQIIE